MPAVLQIGALLISTMEPGEDNMKRNHFFFVAAVVPWLFGSVMMFVPKLMLSNSLAAEFEASTQFVTQWVGFGVFSLGWINFLSRNDEGSPALQAVIVGNILFHTLGIAFDTFHYLIGFMKTSGLLSGIIPHALLAIGFLYYLWKPRTRAVAGSGHEPLPH